MEKIYLFLVEKHTVSNAFTMMETTLVLSVVSLMLLFAVPLFKNEVYLHYTTNKIKDISIAEKTQALMKKEERFVEISKGSVATKERTYKLEAGVVCENYTLLFNARGNIDKGGTISCFYNGKSKDIIVHLGSGNVYVK